MLTIFLIFVLTIFFMGNMLSKKIQPENPADDIENPAVKPTNNKETPNVIVDAPLDINDACKNDLKAFYLSKWLMQRCSADRKNCSFSYTRKDLTKEENIKLDCLLEFVSYGRQFFYCGNHYFYKHESDKKSFTIRWIESDVAKMVFISY
jgi:hypothetical protein